MDIIEIHVARGEGSILLKGFDFQGENNVTELLTWAGVTSLLYPSRQVRAAD